MHCFWNNHNTKAYRTDNYRCSQSKKPLPVDLRICQIYYCQIDKECIRAECVLEENIVLILVVRHEVDQDIGNQQDVSLVPSCQ